MVPTGRERGDGHPWELLLSPMKTSKSVLFQGSPSVYHSLIVYKRIVKEGKSSNVSSLKKITITKWSNYNAGNSITFCVLAKINIPSLSNESMLGEEVRLLKEQ